MLAHSSTHQHTSSDTITLWNTWHTSGNLQHFSKTLRLHHTSAHFCTLLHTPAHVYIQICSLMHTPANFCKLLQTSAHFHTVLHMSTHTSAHLCTLLHTPAHVYIHFHTLLHTPAHFQHTLRYSRTLKHTPFNEGMKKVSQLHPSLPYFTVSSQFKPAHTISSTPPTTRCGPWGERRSNGGPSPLLHNPYPYLIPTSLYLPMPQTHVLVPTLSYHPYVPTPSYTPSFSIPSYHPPSPPPHTHPLMPTLHPPPSPPPLTHPHPLLIPNPTPSPIITIYSLPSLFAQLAWASWAELKPAHLGMAWLGLSHFDWAMLSWAELSCGITSQSRVREHT